ncbi:hypothetical protein JXZ92_02745 [Mycoplasma sp. CSL10137]|uniref:hypothetical protein n=1 Tax=unclassified Mycoplasma TaxID=2683645 RepID=UPI00197BBFB7|nr:MULTISPECIES: hypothetical protein [unclassified Mycoplasma]MBN4083728.1 hypothetical protein [Mycoplasma sp. CSL10137]MBN4084640.1 hypothetical protein [Mycoplasma sp. CSL10166]MBU4693118.1 hypothetical protein [Mycoplasma sp. CSL7491-lung]
MNDWQFKDKFLTLREKWLDFLTDRIIEGSIQKGNSENLNQKQNVGVSKLLKFKFNKWLLNNTNSTYTTNNSKNRIYVSGILLGSKLNNSFEINSFERVSILGGNNIYEKTNKPIKEFIYEVDTSSSNYWVLSDNTHSNEKDYEKIYNIIYKSILFALENNFKTKNN